MAGLTNQGLVIKTRPEILTNFTAKLRDRYGVSFSSDTDTPEGIFSGILADELADVWLGVQGTYDASFPKTASGINLANVADRVGVKPIPENKSNGFVEFTGLVGSVVPATTVIPVEGSEERFETIEDLTLHSTEFSSLTVSIASVVASTTYSLTINGLTASITSSMSPTANTIIAALGAQVVSSVAGVTVSYPTNTTLKIVVDDEDSEYGLIVGARIDIDSISNLVAVEAVNAGEIEAPANTLNSLLVPLVGITSVTNKIAMRLGRLAETDSELRARRYESVSIIGAATNEAITANVRNVEGVIGAFIIENDTYEVDADGRPPKSFEVVVEGGDEETLAETIYSYKPVGIQTIGDVTRIITDSNGQSRVVRFSRPINKYIHVQVDYTKTTEEPFPTSGEEVIKQVVADFGNALNIGQDVFPQRFFKTIFDNVSGVASLVIRVAYSSDGITPSTYTTAPIAVGVKEITLFDTSRITVQEV